MEIKFKIIEMYPDQHSMVVRYWTDLFSQDDLATSISYDENGQKVIQRREDGLPARCQTDYNINIWQVPTPESNAIVEIANNAAPYDWFALKHAVADPTINTSLGNVAVLMNQEFTAVRPVIIQPVIEPQDDSNSLNESNVEALIESLINNITASSGNVQVG